MSLYTKEQIMDILDTYYNDDTLDEEDKVDIVSNNKELIESVNESLQDGSIECEEGSYLSRNVSQCSFDGYTIDISMEFSNSENFDYDTTYEFNVKGE